MDLKNEYTKLLATSISVSIEDLTDNEQKLIDKSFELFKEKIEDMLIATDEVKRLSIELANHKAMHEDTFKPVARHKDDYDDSTYDSHDLDYK
jgi:hypothetical protein